MNLYYGKYVREDGKVAIIYSPEFGLGWSTEVRNKKVSEKMMFDRRIVELILADKREDLTPEYMDRIFEVAEDDDIVFWIPYLQIKWLTPGTKFFIDQYEGSEAVNILDDVDWAVA